MLFEGLEDRRLLATWSGDVPNGTVWSNNEVQRIVGTVRIPEGATLTIEPGTIIKTNALAGLSIRVEGTLIADGTAAQPIVFTSYRDDTGLDGILNTPDDQDSNGDGPTNGNSGEWNSIVFLNGSIGNVLDNVQVRFAGAGSLGAVVIGIDEVALTNSLIRNSSSSGVRLETSDATLTGNAFQNNSTAAISMDLASNPVISGVTLTNNGANALILDSGSLVGNGFWNDADIVYRLTGDVTVPVGSTLMVGAGQIVKFRFLAGDDLLVDGTLNAVGTPAVPIIFTSDQDDSAGGDTSNNGVSVGSNGYWNAIQLRSGSSGHLLDNVEIRYGGAGNTAALVASVPMSLTHSVVRNSSSSGVRLQTSDSTLTSNALQNNLTAAISMDLASNPVISGVTLANNGANALILDSGSLVGNGFWNDADIVYRLSGDVTVPAGSTLTVGAGQIVKFRFLAGDDLLVDGTLNAVGTPAAPIIFTSDQDDSAGGDTSNNGVSVGSNGYWNAIQLRSGSSGHLLDNVEIRYGGAGNSAALVASVPLTLTNSAVRNSSSSGVRLKTSDSILTSNTFQNNSAAAISMDLASNPVITGVTLANNGANALILDSGSLVGNGFWNDADIVYRLTGDVTVPVGSTLMVGAGQIVKFRFLAGDDLLVDGTLNAVGTPAAPIIFTSDQDDSAGGDTSNNGVSVGSNGYWNAIQLRSGSSGHLLDNVDIRHGGAGNSAALVASVPLTLTNSAVRNSSSSGVRLQTSDSTLTSNTFQNNSTAAISMDLASNPVISGVTLTNNGANALILDSGSLVGNGFWNDADIVYRLTGDVTVRVGSTLMVGAGQIVKFRFLAGDDLLVDGTLNAVGTPAAPIIFTSDQDDSAGGDTSNNGVSVGSNGYWNAIQLRSGSSENLLNHVQIRFGGAGNSGALAASAPLTLSNSIVHNSASAGVSAGFSANAQIASNLIFKNGAAGVRAESGAVLSVVNNTIDGNAQGVLAEGASTQVDVVNNLITNNSSSGISRAASATITFTTNDVFNPGRPNYDGVLDQTGLNGNISVDPKYFNLANAQFQLRSGSPAIDSGTSLGAPVLDRLGNPRFDDPKVLNSGQGPQPYFDRGAFERQEVSTSEVDLRVSIVSGPASGIQDQVVHVDWSVQNIGLGSALGSWHDAIYLSSDPIGTPDDQFLGGLTHTGDLGPGAAYSATASVTLPGVLPGAYYFIVRTNSQQEVFEALALENNMGASTNSVAMDLPALVFGTPSSGHIEATSSAKFYKIASPAGADLAVNLSGLAGATNELYLKFGDIPSRQSFLERGIRPDQPTQLVSVASTRAGNYFVMVVGTNLPSPETFTLTATLVGFSISGVTPARGSNTGQVTIAISGAQFDANSQVQLIDSNNGTLLPTQVFFTDSGLISATFNLTGRPTGLADVRVINTGSITTTLADSFNIVVGNSGALVTNIAFPDRVRLGRSFSVTIEYFNAGDTDIAAPILQLTPTRGLAGLSLKDGETDPPTALRLLGTSPTGPAGILAPGAKGRISVFGRATANGDESIELSVGEFPNGNIDWNVLEPSLRPAGLSDPAWARLFAQLRSDIGSTWTDFVTALSRRTTLLPALLGNRHSFEDVFGLLLEETIGKLNTSVSGSLFLRDTAHPLGNVGLSLRNAAAGTAVEAVTLNDGNYLFPEVEPGTYELSAEEFLLSSPVTIVVGATDVFVPPVIATTTASISGGIVLKGFGAPLNNVTVTALGTDGSLFSTLTRGDGSYRLGSLPTGTYRLTAAGDFLVPSKTEGINVTAGQQLEHVSLVLQREATISGQLTGFNGVLPAGSTVFAVDKLGVTFTAVTPSANGQYQLGKLPPRVYDIFASVPGSVLGQFQNVTVGEGDSVTGRNISLVPGGSISGALVIAGTSSGPAEQVVNLKSGATLVASAVTRSNGIFSFSGIAAGSYALSVTVDGFISVSSAVTIQAGQTVSSTLTLQANGSISGSVRDSHGQPLSGMTVTAQDHAGARMRSTTSALGQFSFGNLALGSYTVFAGAPDSGGLIGQDVTLNSATPQATVNLVAPVSAILTGIVRDSDGTTPLADTIVELRSGGLLVTSAQTDSTGTYLVRVVAGGTFDLVVRAPNRSFTAQTGVTLVAGGPPTTRNFNSGSAVLSGVVTNAATGLPVAGAAVLLLQQVAPDVEIAVGALETDVDGSFSAGGLVDGNYRIRAAAADLALIETVVARSSAPVNLALGASTTIAGRIVEPSGKAVAGTEVWVSVAGTTQYVASARTDANGDYQVTGLARGSYDIVVMANGFRQLEKSAINTTAQAPAIANAELISQDTSVQGRITANGKPSAGASVIFVDSAGRDRGAVLTDSNGNYRNDSLPPGSYQVQVTNDGMAPLTDTVNVSSGQTAVHDAAFVPSAENGLLPPSDNLAVRGIEWLVRLFNTVDRDANHPTSIPGFSPGCEDHFAVAGRYLRIADTQFDLWQQAQFNYLPKISSVEAVGNFLVPLKDTILLLGPGAKLLVDFKKYLGGIRNLVAGSTRPNLVIKEALAALAVVEKADFLLDLQSAATFLYNNITGNNVDSDGALGAKIDLFQVASSILARLAKMRVTLSNLGLDGFIKDGLGPIAAVIEITNGMVSAIKDLGPTLDDMLYAKREFNHRLSAYQAAVANANASIASLIACNKVSDDHSRGVPGPLPPVFRPTTTRGLQFRNSFDPNDKHGPAGTGSDNFIQSGVMPFQIQFENDPNMGATIPAQEVFVTDLLDADLDLSTVEFTGFGFGNFEFTVPPGLSEYEITIDLRPEGINLLVPVKLKVNSSTRVLTATFRSLDPRTGLLPEDIDAGFLPVNNKTLHDGEGYFTYTVRPAATRATGTVVTNQASIVFDVNAPILTPTTLHTLDVGLPTSQVSALPAKVGKTFNVRWQGEDDMGGSGVASYDIYVSIDGSSPVLWLADRQTTEATFTGSDGHDYAFYSIATDAVGNREVAPLQADASTFVSGPLWQNPGTSASARFDVTNDHFVTPLDVLTIINDLNKNGGRALPTNGSQQPPPFFDVNGDGFISPLDALLVINFINQQIAGGEGELSESVAGKSIEMTQITDDLMANGVWLDEPFPDQVSLRKRMSFE